MSVHLGDSCKGTPCICSHDNRAAPAHAAAPHCSARKQKLSGYDCCAQTGSIHRGGMTAANAESSSCMSVIILHREPGACVAFDAFNLIQGL